MEEKNLLLPQDRLRKRASSTAIGEQLESRKRPTFDERKGIDSDENMDNDKRDNEAGESEDEMEMIYKMALLNLDIKQRKKEKEERGLNERGWVENHIKVVQHCTMCGDRTEKGLKCDSCTHQLCLHWLSEIQEENSDGQASKHRPNCHSFTYFRRPLTTRLLQPHEARDLRLSDLHRTENLPQALRP